MQINRKCWQRTRWRPCLWKLHHWNAPKIRRRARFLFFIFCFLFLFLFIVFFSGNHWTHDSPTHERAEIASWRSEAGSHCLHSQKGAGPSPRRADVYISSCHSVSSPIAPCILFFVYIVHRRRISAFIMSEAEWRECFDKFDSDCSGCINRCELIKCLEELFGGDHDKAVDVGAVSIHVIHDCM